MEVLNGVVSTSKSIPSKFNIPKSSSSISSKPTHLSFSNRPAAAAAANGFSSRCCVAEMGNGGFENKDHFDYYQQPKVKGKGKGNKGWDAVSTKKKIKLLKGLTKDLSTFSDLGFGFPSDFTAAAAAHPDPNNNSIIISQAAEVLLAKLKQLRTEEEENLKNKEKDDKKNKCKKDNDCDSSESESSSDSDSECDDKVVDLKRLRNVSIVERNETKDTLTASGLLDQGCSNMILEATLGSKTCNETQLYTGKKRIEVCMGGKCKKSGAPALMEELQKAIGGDEGGVTGCKCMGKCKSGPNVKVVSSEQTLSLGDDDSFRYPPNNPLYIGVGLEDVDMIVATYFGDEIKDLGMSIASVAS